uniref:Reverse transcriptase domain-containing protein n=1 Tax=Haemonchus placei TaxID=6290 RepID=A0A158QKG7_HAEPC
NFSKHVKSITFHGHRLAILTAYLTRDSQVTIIKAYASAADSDEGKHHSFYEQLEELVRRQRGYVVVMGDFNARVGSRKHDRTFQLREKKDQFWRKRCLFCHQGTVETSTTSQLADVLSRLPGSIVFPSTFTDYKKAFDSVEPVKVWESLEEQGVERIYVDVLRECYSDCTTVFHSFYNDVVVALQKGVRQWDPISPNLFSACLEHVIRSCNWSNFGVNIDGVRLNHLRFADDIVLITDSPEHASEMLHRLDEEGSHCGLTINTSMTKEMRNQFSGDTPVLLEGGAIENVGEYVYLGSQLNMRNDLTGELARRRKAGWAAFKSIRRVLEETRDCKLRADFFNSTALRAPRYAEKPGL